MNIAVERVARLLGVAGILLLAACGGGGEPPPQTPAAFEPRSVAQPIGVSGGTVELAAADGTLYRLEIPAGALAGEATLQLATAEPPEGGRARLQAAPAGLRFALPATLTIAPPPGQPFGANLLAVFGDTPMPAGRNGAGAIVLSLPTLPGGEEPVASAPAAGGRKQARAAPRPQCGIVVGGPTGYGLVDLFDPTEVTDLAVLSACVQTRIALLERTGKYEQAIRLNLATSTFLQRVGADPAAANAAGFLQSARDEVCRRRTQALSFAAIKPMDSVSAVVQVHQLVLYWEKQTQQLGASCTATPGDYVDVLQAKIAQSLAWVASKRGSLGAPGSPEHAEALAGAAQASQLRAEMTALQPPVPAIDQQVLRDQIEQRLEPALSDAMLDGPWSACRSSGDYGPLHAIVNAFGGIGRLGTGFADAVHYCGATLGAQSRKADGSALASLADPLGGVDPRSSRSAGTIAVVKGGTLRVEGPIRALQCPSGVTGAEALVVLVDGTEVARAGAAPFLGGGLEFGIDDLITRAGADPATVTRLTLTLRREGDGCGGYWGAPRAPLVTLTLDLRSVMFAGGYVGSSVQDVCGGGRATGYVEVTLTLSGSVDALQGGGRIFIAYQPPFGGTNIIDIGPLTGTGDPVTGASVTGPADGGGRQLRMSVTPTRVSGTLTGGTCEDGSAAPPETFTASAP